MEIVKPALENDCEAQGGPSIVLFGPAVGGSELPPRE